MSGDYNVSQTMNSVREIYRMRRKRSLRNPMVCSERLFESLISQEGFWIMLRPISDMNSSFPIKLGHSSVSSTATVRPMRVTDGPISV